MKHNSEVKYRLIINRVYLLDGKIYKLKFGQKLSDIFTDEESKRAEYLGTFEKFEKIK